ncbi:WYL domain-containing protein [Companilactobacillus sp.]|uniref:helix-turn-helix transcriptional regulator n=1 Tax=Companilactobacillus sp. TaxID=2767905 RepID=UPI002626B358|nr:WYL domain-containing protein [Companilactobacillus sp.]
MELNHAMAVVFRLLEAEKESRTELCKMLNCQPEEISDIITLLKKLNFDIKVSSGRYPTYALNTQIVMFRRFVRLDQFLALNQAITNKPVPMNKRSLANFVKKLMDEADRLPFGTLSYPDLHEAAHLINLDIASNTAQAYLASQKHRILNIQYYDTKGVFTTRDIEPMEVFYQDHEWYIWAFCRLRNDLRIFKVESIYELETTRTKFIRKPFDLKNGTEDPRSFRDRYLVNLEFNPSQHTFVNKTFKRDKVVNLPDRILVLEKDFYNEEFAIKWLQTVKQKFKVQSPKALQKKLQSQ